MKERENLMNSMHFLPSNAPGLVCAQKADLLVALELRADAYQVDSQPRGWLILGADAGMTGTICLIAWDRRNDAMIRGESMLLRQRACHCVYEMTASDATGAEFEGLQPEKKSPNRQKSGLSSLASINNMLSFLKHLSPSHCSISSTGGRLVCAIGALLSVSNSTSESSSASSVTAGRFGLSP